MKYIDLRSDTVTLPTDEMRRVMASAEVGDDVFGEDPSVNKLQEYVASLLGKEAALFVPSGTMSNQIAVKSHTLPGDEIICEENAHIYNYESAGPSFHSGVQVKPLPGSYGMITAEAVRSAIRPDNIHAPRSSLVSIENTHNRAGGTIFPLEEIKKISAVCKELNLALHMDGARLMNAVVATGIPPEEWARHCDSVSICLSKGLGAPVGSVLSGDKEFIQKALRFRKIFGGGMRQAGILAAAGLYALQNHVERLNEDHENARLLAEGLNEIPGINIDLDQVQTNIVMLNINSEFSTAAEVAEEMKKHGLLMIPFSALRIRAVTHLGIRKSDIRKALDIISKIMQNHGN